MPRSWIKARLALLAPLAACVAATLPAACAAATPVAPIAPAPKPPLAYSGYAAQVSTSSATIDAGVNPRGLETSYYLQYGPTAAYGAQTQPAAAGAATTEAKVSQTLSGLAADTTYHFRLVASNAAGTTEGPDRTFLTKRIPLTLTISATPNPDVFGSPFSVEGNLAGSENANQVVILQANPFPYTAGFEDVGKPELSGATGSFSISDVTLVQSTQLRVRTPGPPIVYSPVLIERVAVHVTFHVRSTARRGFYRLYGSVTPAVVGARVGFQRLTASGNPVNVTGTRLKHGSATSSRFSRTVRIRHKGLYRAAIQVTSPMLVSNHSGVARIR